MVFQSENSLYANPPADYVEQITTINIMTRSLRDEMTLKTTLLVCGN